MCPFRYRKYGTYAMLRTNSVGWNKINLLIKLAFIYCAYFNNTFIRINTYQHFFEYLFVYFFFYSQILYLNFPKVLPLKATGMSSPVWLWFRLHAWIVSINVLCSYYLKWKQKLITFEISFYFKIRLHDAAYLVVDIKAPRSTSHPLMLVTFKITSLVKAKSRKNFFFRLLFVDGRWSLLIICSRSYQSWGKRIKIISA